MSLGQSHIIDSLNWCLVPDEFPEKSETTSENTLASEPPSWPLWQRLLFRYFFCYLFLYLFPFPFSLIPLLNYVVIPWEFCIQPLIAGTAAYFFHVQPDWSSAASGSGDQLIRYIELASYAGFAAVATIIWSIVDRRRRQYTFLFALLRIWALMFVSSNMLNYGSCKLFPSQFPPLQGSVLAQTVGEKSPMGLLWTFMSGSQPYTIFTGLAEFTAGLLLAIPCTRILGALMCVAVATEIVMLNMCYDVPVKILSGHLLMLSIFLLLPHAKNLFNIFFRQKNGTAFPSLELFTTKKFNLILWSLVWLLLTCSTTRSLVYSYQSFKSSQAELPKIGDYKGSWTVDSYQYFGQPLPADLLADCRWESLWVYEKLIQAWGPEEKWKSFKLTRSNNGKDLDLVAKENQQWKAHLASEMPDVSHWILRGEVDGIQCEIRLHRVDRSKYLLLNRGFHWVNEKPFNR